MYQTRKLALDLEEMTALEDLGLDTSDASMIYKNSWPEFYPDRQEWRLEIRGKYDSAYPRYSRYAYTLDDILRRLPKVIEKDNGTYEADLYTAVEKPGKFIMAYTEGEGKFLVAVEGETPLEAGKRMLMECLKKGYVI